jgi:hypothetical protein
VSFKAIQWALEQEDVFGLEKSVLIILAFRDAHDEPHGCFPSLNRMASDCGINRSTVIRLIKRLVEKGKVKSDPRRRPTGESSSNYYTFPQVWAVEISVENKKKQKRVVATRYHGSRKEGERVVAPGDPNLKGLTVNEPSRSALPVSPSEEQQFKNNFLSEMKRVAGEKSL